MILSICEVPETLKIVRIIKIVITLIKIVVPIMLIVMIMIDLTKDVIANNKETLKIITSRLVAAILIFLVPTFVVTITSLIFPKLEYMNCFDNARSEVINSLYESNMESIITKLERSKDEDTFRYAINYLNNIKDDNKRKEYESALNKIEEEIEKEKKDSQIVSNESFLSTARSVYSKIVSGDKNFTYHQGNNIPLTGTYCDCSSYVSWVLLEYGYEDFKGWQHTTAYFMGSGVKKYNWDITDYKAGTDISPFVKPGDIIVRRANGHGHTNIIASVNGNNILAYDCGNSNRVKNGKYPDGSPTLNFLKNDKRPARIIRVTKPD